MPTVTLRSYERFKNGCPQCGDTQGLRLIGTGRSIWRRPFLGGDGDVHNVGVVYCPKCDPEPVPPPYGTPIYEDEIIETVGAA